MQTRYTLSWLIGLVGCLGIMLQNSAHAIEAPLSSPKLQTLDQLSRLQIPVNNASTFRMVRGSGETTIVLERVSAAQLASLKSLSDQRVAGLSVKAVGLDSAEIQLSFREQGTESFAYLQGTPPVLVVDLWNQEKSIKNIAATEEEFPKEKVAKVAPKKVKKISTKNRSIASVEKKSVEQEAKSLIPIRKINPIQLDKDLFVKFVQPMPELKMERKEGLSLPPDLKVEEKWTFAKGDKETMEGKSFEYSKRLYKEEKYGLALKTIEIALRDYPKSPHVDELKLLKAFAYKKLGENTKKDALTIRADELLTDLIAKPNEEGKFPAYTKQVRLYFGNEFYLKENWLSAIEQYEAASALMDNKEGDYPYLQLLLADAYGKVNQPRRAERFYRFLTQNFPNHPAGKESAYRMADLLATEKNYKRVVELGEEALNDFASYEKTRPEVLFNIGEANFWLGSYAKSEKYFRKFIDNYSSQTISALAWVRLGEIAELTKRNLNQASELYSKAKNGYPFSLGDLVASVRLARINTFTEKDPAYIAKNLTELLSQDKIDWELRRMAELVLIDYAILTDQVDRAISISRSGMADTDGVAYENYKQAYTRSLFVKINELNSEKKFREALALYDRERKWFDLYGAESYKSAAQTYRGLGLYATSNEFMEKYAKEAAKGRGIASLDKDEAMLTEKARNSFARGAYAEVLSLLPNANDSQVLYMKSLSEFRLGQKIESYKTAEKAFAIFAKEKESITDTMVEETADLLIERDDKERDFAKMSKDIESAIQLLKKDNERLIYAKADALWYQKEHAAAVVAYKAALEKFPKSTRAERSRYNMGMSLVNLGKREEAVKVLTDLRNESQSVWADSAKQELELMDWEKKYSSVLRTLPPSGLGIAK